MQIRGYLLTGDPQPCFRSIPGAHLYPLLQAIDDSPDRIDTDPFVTWIRRNHWPTDFDAAAGVKWTDARL